MVGRHREITGVSDLRERLQATLGSAYTIQRELGGGGMSRVFLAEEVALGRPIVLKVLPPEMAASVNIERFLMRDRRGQARSAFASSCRCIRQANEKICWH